MFSFLAFIVFIQTAQAVEFQFVNNEYPQIWIGIQGNPGHAQLSNGGFIMQGGQTVSLIAEENWSGRFWARTWCYNTTGHCDTGDCGNGVECNGAAPSPPVTLVGITLKADGVLDHYGVSVVEGVNLRISIEPINGIGDGTQYSCKESACPYHFLTSCPKALQLINSDGYFVACKSACDAFNSDQYCCRGEFSTPSTCLPSEWPINYAAYFKQHCPYAKTYIYDEENISFTCLAEKYVITFS